MQKTRDAYTFLTHLFGRGLEDTRYAVERFKSMDDGDVRPLPAGGRTAKGTARGEARDRLTENRAADAARAGRDHRLHGP